MGSALAESALKLYGIGLAVVPAAKDDGKSVAGIVKGFQHWKRRLPQERTAALFQEHPAATIALLVGHCGLVVVDCDSDDALVAAEARYGYSPILVRTPSGRGGHLYYGAPQEPVHQANLRSSGLEIDIKAGKGAYVIVPPSVRPSNGVAYRFERGSWADLNTLPVFRPVIASRHADRAMAGRRVDDGERNNYLFKSALRLARDCETCGELETKGAVVNERDCNPPLDHTEVVKVVTSAWSYETSGTNRVGQGQYIQIPKGRLDRLADEPYAFLLDASMRFGHDGLRPSFFASPKAMSKDNVMPGWSVQRYRAAIRVLVARGVWVLLKEGGKRPGDPHEYGFADRSPETAMGAKSAPNTNYTPSPLAFEATAFPRSEAA